jgi:nicotinamide phosphoribosyltransferase
MGQSCSGNTVDGDSKGDSVNNIILLTDSYKISHWKQYPQGTTNVYSYFESRGCVIPAWKEVVFFGLQYFMKEYLEGVVVTQGKIEAAYDMLQHHFGAEFLAKGLTNPGNFNRTGWEYILKKHGGRLPIAIKAVPEGMVVPCKTVLMTVENTDPECYWLSNYLETLLVQVWYPMTVASQSREQKRICIEYLKKTGCDMTSANPGYNAGTVGFMLNDFGFRGVSSCESAMIGGAAHLVNFIGSDNMAAIHMCNKYYGAGPGKGFHEGPSFSIPASEHSTITSWGKDREVEAMRNMLEQYPEGLVACVSDSFDIYKACEQYWGTELKELIEKRPGPAGRLVVRPDSGEPTEVVPKCLEILISKFGCSTTSTGHRLLPNYIRMIQGDGVNYETIRAILEIMHQKKLATENLVFGSGGALLQRLDRDTFKCAFKCSEITVNGKSNPVFKDPATDPGKASKQGRLTLQRAIDTVVSAADTYKSSKESGVAGGKGHIHRYETNSEYVTVAEGKGDKSKDLLVEVFRDGRIIKEWSFNEVRTRADLPQGPFAGAKPYA